MSRQQDGRDSTPLRRALAAEREARDDLERAEAEARALVDEARARVRAIERRAEARIGRVSRAAREETQRLLEQQQEQERSVLERLERTPEDEAALEAAARAVALALTGGEADAQRPESGDD